jgi:hypothetical protein
MKVREIKDAGAQLPVIVYSEAAFKMLMLCMKSTHAKSKEFMMVGSVERHENIFNINDCNFNYKLKYLEANEEKIKMNYLKFEEYKNEIKSNKSNKSKKSNKNNSEE